MGRANGYHIHGWNKGPSMAERLVFRIWDADTDLAIWCPCCSESMQTPLHTSQVLYLRERFPWEGILCCNFAVTVTIETSSSVVSKLSRHIRAVLNALCEDHAIWSLKRVRIHYLTFFIYLDSRSIWCIHPSMPPRPRSLGIRDRRTPIIILWLIFLTYCWWSPWSRKRR